METGIEREIVLPATVDEVWDALTSGGRLSVWFGADVELDARPGATATFRWPDGTERRALVEVVDAPNVFAFRWLPFQRGPDGRVGPSTGSRVEFRCEETAAGTRLRIIETPSAHRQARLWAGTRT